MYLIYLAESGQTGTSIADSKQPHHICVGLLLRSEQWHELGNGVHAIYNALVGKQLGVNEAPKILNPSHILQGKGYFRGLPKSKRIDLMDHLIGLLVQQEVRLLVAYIDKNQFASAMENNKELKGKWQDPWQPVFVHFVHILDIYMDEMLAAQAFSRIQVPEGMSQEDIHQLYIKAEADMPKEHALIIAEGSRYSDSSFMNRSLKLERDLPSDQLLDNIYFGSAQDSSCTQLAKLCAYLVRRRLYLPAESSRHYSALEKGGVMQVIYPIHI